MKQVIDGNEAAALAAKLARVKVISAYPITPQTTVVEKLADYVSNGELEAEFIKVSTIKSRDYFASTDAKFIARENEVGGMGGLQRIMGGASITSG